MAVLLSLVPATTLAQEILADTSRPQFTLERSVGFSWISTGGNAGRVTGRRVYVTEFQWTSPGVAKGPVELAYRLDVVPLVVVERTEPNRLICFDQAWRTVCHRDASVRVAAGAGGAPVGASLILNRAGSTRLRFGSALGMLVFSSDVPIYNSRRLNFRYEYSAGFEHVLRSGRTLSVGYKFFHVSNAGMGQYNPGLDANIVYVGLAERRK